MRRDQLISQKTCTALAELRARGVRLGRPRRCPDDVLARVVAARLAGARLVDISDRLNDDGVPTPAGSARWHPSHVSRLLRTQDAVRLRESEVRARRRGDGHADYRPLWSG
ncbi:recombinase family protein [Polymorphospora rubra]|uniref:recombinase family protein n=1 Tax=Polymorphospora rubra TaxID=338584 RepID=UPI0033DEF56D